MVIESLLYRNSAAFLDVIRRWSVITPPLFNHAIVLQRLQRKNLNLGKGYNDDEKDAEKDKDKDKDKHKDEEKEKDREKGKENLLVKKWDLAEAQAQLHIVAKDHGEALNCYLGMHASHTGDSHEDEEREGERESNGASGFSSGDVEEKDASSSSSSSGPLSAYGRVRKHTYRHVFELIEREVRKFHFVLFCFILICRAHRTTCPALLYSALHCTALRYTALSLSPS